MLWAIEGDELPGISYLFGTMHVRDSRVLESFEKIFEKIRTCDGFAAEFHLDAASDSSFDPPHIQLSEFQPLTKLIPGKKYQRLRKIFLKATSLDLDLIQNSPPFVIVSQLAGQMLPSDMPVSLDEYLWNLAKKESKSLFGIETIQEQIEVLKKISMNEQVNMLLEAGQNIKSYRRHLLHLSALYQTGNFSLLYQSVQKNTKGLRKLLLYRRNQIMADRIFDLAQKQTVFFAIGAAHLGGGKGVIRLLKQHGLSVSPR